MLECVPRRSISCHFGVYLGMFLGTFWIVCTTCLGGLNEKLKKRDTFTRVARIYPRRANYYTPN